MELDVESEILSHRAEVFRSKLIEDFQILDSYSEEGRRKAPVYTSADIIKPGTLAMEKVLIETPEQMIKFKVYKRHDVRVDTVDRRLIRVKNQNKLPVGVWAAWIVENDHFQNFIFALIIINSIGIGIEGELPLTNDVGINLLKMFLEFIDAFTVIVFSMEIILKWVDSFRKFWKNPWNVFDFIATALSATPLVMFLFASDDTSQIAIIAKSLTVFRIIRALKMIARFGRLRIIVLTVLQAFQSLVFICILLSMVTYIFAIVGVILFDDYTKSDRTDLIFHTRFSSLLEVVITLFQLFTLDQWYRIYNDLIKVIHPLLACTYTLLWVWIGSFMFRNIFVGIMVNNFQSITEEIFLKSENIDQNEELARMKEELNVALTRHDLRMSKVRRSVFVPIQDVSVPHFEEAESIGGDLREQISQMMLVEEKISAGWDKTVHSHLMALASKPVETLWPRDTLFKYYQLMEQLQKNLEEYDKLQKLASMCLIALQDNEP